VLTDDNKRRRYDLHGEEGLKENKQRSPFSFFEEDTSERHLPHQVLPLPVTLEDLYIGRMITAQHRKHIICPKCRGSGARKSTDIKKCPGCGGTGMKVKTMQFGGFGYTQVQQTCDECGGKGTTITHKCEHCNGKKVDIGEELITVYIERGMDDGDEIVLFY
jgi:DnaJ-related protein SCJ1